MISPIAHHRSSYRNKSTWCATPNDASAPVNRIKPHARSRVHARELFRMLKDRTKRMSGNFSVRHFRLQRAADKNYLAHRDVGRAKISRSLYETFGICLLGAV